MLARFNGSTELCPGTWEYSLTPERPLDYISGQYVEVAIQREFADRRGRGRIFTLTSLPEEPELKFALQFPEPGSPYKQQLRQLAPGEAVRIGDAMGDVVLPKNPDIPLVFIAGGLGIASFVSILRSLNKASEQRTIHLFYGRREASDQPYQQLVDTFPFTAKTYALSPQRLQTDDIMQVVTSESLVYLSGSQPFVEGLRADLLQRGVAHEQTVFDYYDGYREL